MARLMADIPVEGQVAGLKAALAWDEFTARYPWALVGCGIVKCGVCGSDDMIYRNRRTAGSLYRCRVHGGITAGNSTVD